MIKQPITWEVGRNNEIEYLDADGNGIGPDELVAAINASAAPEALRSDPGTEKILWNLLDRAYKMMLMAIGPVHEQDPDSNDPIVAWASDVRKVLYGSGRVPSLADIQSLPSPLRQKP